MSVANATGPAIADRGTAPLLGLVLAGGRSKRMRTDKAALLYGGRSQLERAMALIAPHVARAYVSVRADQGSDPLRARFSQIPDSHENLGPIAGLLAAQARHPEAAWLVLACDLPLLDDARRPPTDRATTACRSLSVRSGSRAAPRRSSPMLAAAATVRAASCWARIRT